MGSATDATNIAVAKKTSWVEVYFDLIFVLAIAQVAHVVAAEPDWRALGVAAGLFTVLWWTWIGYAVFYNRYGDDSSLWQRLTLIAATIPCGLAAVSVPAIAHGERMIFTLSLAGARLLLVAAHLIQGGALPRRIAVGYVVSAAIIAASLLLPAPWWWLLWIAAIVGESATVFASGPRPEPTERQLDEVRRDWRKSFALFRPAAAEYALNVGHLVERFGLFIIILLGEVVASAGQAAIDGRADWADVTAVLVLSGILWWVAFDAEPKATERMFALAGGSPQMARSSFAIGWMIPAFALVVVAAGLKLLAAGGDSPAAVWMLSIGLGTYLLGMRIDVGRGLSAWLRLAVLALTYAIGFVGLVLPPTTYLWLVCVWAAVCAAMASVGSRVVNREIAEEAFSE
jgi:low temperature requirement protein LtrA